MNLSPIVLFTYLRFDKLKRTISALRDNYLASESDLFIFSDAALYKHDEKQVLKIRKYLQSIVGFKSISIIESNINLGLASSIINGVTYVLNNYGKVIVLEDDLCTSRNFLNFMNQSLEKYKDLDAVYSISGYKHNLVNNQPGDAFFLNRSWSWGWATWADRWESIDWSVQSYDSFSKNRIQQRQFSLLGSDVNGMLKKQMEGYLDSWFIRFIFHQFTIQGLTLYPSVSKICNDGWDVYATNTRGLPDRYTTDFDTSDKTNFDLPDIIEIDHDYQVLFNKKFSVKERLINKFQEYWNL